MGLLDIVDGARRSFRLTPRRIDLGGQNGRKGSGLDRKRSVLGLEEEKSFYDISELTNIARPFIGAQHMKRFRRKRSLRVSGIR